MPPSVQALPYHVAHICRESVTHSPTLEHQLLRKTTTREREKGVNSHPEVASTNTIKADTPSQSRKNSIRSSVNRPTIRHAISGGRSSVVDRITVMICRPAASRQIGRNFHGDDGERAAPVADGRKLTPTLFIVSRASSCSLLLLSCSPSASLASLASPSSSCVGSMRPRSAGLGAEV